MVLLIPLNQLGRSMAAISELGSEGTVIAIEGLWSSQGCLPEFAPALSEAATVAQQRPAAAARKRFQLEKYRTRCLLDGQDDLSKVVRRAVHLDLLLTVPY
jgi:hypothetical protein